MPSLTSTLYDFCHSAGLKKNSKFFLQERISHLWQETTKWVIFKKKTFREHFVGASINSTIPLALQQQLCWAIVLNNNPLGIIQIVASKIWWGAQIGVITRRLVSRGSWVPSPRGGWARGQMAGLVGFGVEIGDSTPFLPSEICERACFQIYGG